MRLFSDEIATIKVVYHKFFFWEGGNNNNGRNVYTYSRVEIKKQQRQSDGKQC